MANYYLRNLPGSLLEINNENHTGMKMTVPVVIKYPSKKELLRFFNLEYGAPTGTHLIGDRSFSLTSALQLASTGESFRWQFFIASYISQSSKKLRISLYLGADRLRQLTPGKEDLTSSYHRSTKWNKYSPWTEDQYRKASAPSAPSSYGIRKATYTYREAFNNRVHKMNASPENFTFQEIAVLLGISLTDTSWEGIPVVFQDSGGILLGPELHKRAHSNRK